MANAKSGKDIVDRLYREISRAGDDLQKLDAGDGDFWRCRSALHALNVMRQTVRLLVDLIADVPAPRRPGRKRKPASRAEPG